MALYSRAGRSKKKKKESGFLLLCKIRRSWRLQRAAGLGWESGSSSPSAPWSLPGAAGTCAAASTSPRSGTIHWFLHRAGRKEASTGLSAEHTAPKVSSQDSLPTSAFPEVSIFFSSILDYFSPANIPQSSQKRAGLGSPTRSPLKL